MAFFQYSAGMFFFKSFSIISFAVLPLLFGFSADAQTRQTVMNSKECGMSLAFAQGGTHKISMRKIDGILVDSFFPAQKNLRRLSKVCEIVIASETEYNSNKSFDASFQHIQTEFRPRVYLWDVKQNTWVSNESVMNRKKANVSTSLQAADKLYVAVFADERSSYVGIASWYRHKRYQFGSATNIFPIGTALKVTNTDTGKNVNVTVTSTWTNKNKKRVIDLVRTAFEKIGNPSDGLIPVIIERKAPHDKT